MLTSLRDKCLHTKTLNDAHVHLSIAPITFNYGQMTRANEFVWMLCVLSHVDFWWGQGHSASDFADKEKA